jgi:FkbM family methyltransferase
MPLTRSQTTRIMVTMFLPWRKLLGKQPVRRTVQGVELEMPRQHLLPIYAKVNPTYGQNLVELAAGLDARRPGVELQVLDIGANIGDSALQIAAGVDGARVLCVEGDPYWAGYLRKNVGGHDRIAVEEVLLTGEDGDWEAASPVREGGTTRFVQDTDKGGALPAVSARAIRERHPEFDQVRLVKCDTDGFDPILVPAAAGAWRDVGPVLFFEFDPGLARAADSRDPNAVWDALAALGYTQLAIWDNAGDPLGRLPISEAAEHAKSLEPRPTELGYHFWDVAACREDDADALAVFDALVPEPFSVHGTWR